MASQLSAPVSTTVIALDVPAAAGVSAETQGGFERTISALVRQLGFVSTEPSENPLALTVTLAPDAAVDSALRRLAAAIGEFEGRHPPLCVRAMVHYGVVFRTDSGGQAGFMGSAIRSAQSALRRAPATVGLVATKEFSGFASALAQSQFSLEPAGGGAVDGLSLIRFVAESATASKPGDRLSSSDPELLQFLKKRLAEDLGPFASALADNARRSASTAGQLITALSREIDAAAARQRFEADADAYIKSRARNAAG